MTETTLTYMERRHTNAYINALEARVASLEKQLAQRNGDPGTPDSTKGSSNCDHEEVAFVSSTQASQPDPNSTTSEEDMDDLANALGCFTLGEIGELRYFGASSNFSIIHNHAIKVPSSIQARNRGIEAANNMPDFITPSDEMRDHLLEIFWRWQNSWQYIVPRELFVRDLYVEKNGRYCTPSLMAAILAMSSRYSPRLELRTDPDDANTAGEAFAAQAKTMLHYECEAPTTSTVQATALLGLYWATIDNEGLGFMYIGMATRMAMNLGLHCDCSPYASKGLVSDDDVEARNVTFWGVYVLDKFYCLGMGRPASIQEYNITTTKPKGLVQHSPLLSDYHYGISAPFPTSHILENSMYTCELLLATSEVIDQLYAQRYAWTDKEREDRVMKAHLQAVGLFDRLPKSLKISSSSLQCSPPYVYQFHLQYHHAILLLHRPFFQLLNPGKNAIAYDPEGGDIHSKSCRESAVKMARILQIFRKNYTIMSKSLKVAAIQAEPVWNDLQGGVNKSIGLIQEAAKEGANVIGFPEVFIPGYPWSIWANSPTENAPWINEYFKNSMEKESPEMDQIRAAVREAGVFVVLGYSERYRGTLYIAQSFIDETGTIVLHRRKIKPTHVERAIYGDGQGESLTNVADTKFGRVAGLNCWEHTQTLLRYYEYSQDVDIHVSSWPSIFPQNVPEWPYHITPECCKAFSHVVSMEGACFVLLASQIMTEENHKKANVDGYDYTKKSGGGFSMIFSPFGEELVKPLAPNEEGILYADINLEEKYKAKQNLDIVGHYSRPDQLSLRVNKHAAKPVFFANDL
ncbi:hypothetical protein FVER53590_11865 [Fusarium verticillioides]|nr:hypothetical protein FVER53590_11865 [Fusarium verticillioides]